MKIVLELPDEFKRDFEDNNLLLAKNQMIDSFERIKVDVKDSKNGISGTYEIEILDAFIKAFENVEILQNQEKAQNQEKFLKVCLIDNKDNVLVEYKYFNDMDKAIKYMDTLPTLKNTDEKYALISNITGAKIYQKATIHIKEGCKYEQR